ncbi:YtzI protein [Brevibacillus sp. 7WMA2]|nr:YtzI protein [Brevibacillus laterosporus]MBA4535346.1 YtzI protein [Brevibacillus halotolerans]QIC06643.1 YtzI protein [Brevibacillus sp. 7WMA2]CCF13826.1 putative membrane protein [Brevibacillus laterosporus GI-9]HAS00414.1 YtzI protein [Brevibacillus sp.]
MSSMIIAVVVIVGIIVGCSIWAINKGYSYKNKIDDIDE